MTVFMTMEVLEGQPLDVYIRKLPAEGLTEEEAMPMIDQLCKGLAYAHSHGLVHSDLKPGNCFLTKEGNIKLLDFGIARASSTKADEEGEATLFDPGELGALTPTYATIEMFDGQDPDPRDDIYALAIMAYQLLTSKHPFGKKSAPKAKELGLAPEPVDKLDKRQNRGVRRGLEFHREDRSPSVEQFIEDITKRKSRAPLIATIATVLVVLIGVGAFNPVMNVIKEGKREEIISAIEQPGIDNIRNGLQMASALGDADQLELILEDDRTKQAVARHIGQGDEKSIEEGLGAIAEMPKDWQQDVKDVDAAKRAVFDLYDAKILAAFDAEAGKYDYQAAAALVKALGRLYADSAEVLRRENSLERDKEDKLGDLTKQYNTYLKEGRLIASESEDDIGDVLAVVQQINPEHRLLSDEQLKFRFQDLAKTAIDEDDFARADAFLKASVAYAPEDPTLNNLRYRVRTELQRIENEKRVAEIQARLRSQLASLRSLEDFQKVRDDLIVLADLSPTNPVLTQIQSNLETAFTAALEKLVNAEQWEPGEQLIVNYAKLLELEYLTEKRTVLSKAAQGAGFALAVTEEREAEIASRVAKVDALLAKPEFTSDWEIQLKGPYKELVAMLPLGDARLEEVRSKTAKLYIGQAQRARESGSFSEALAFVNKGKVFYPGLTEFVQEQSAIATAEEAERKRLEEERRLAKIKSMKLEFQETAARDEIDDAKRILGELGREKLAADDSFLAEEAPVLLAQAYHRRAAALAEAEDFESALTLANAGLELAPELEDLKSAVSAYGGEVRKRQRQIALTKLFKSRDQLDVAKVSGELEQLKGEQPNNYAKLVQQFAKFRGDSLLGYAADPKVNFAVLGRRLAEFEKLFPKAHGELSKVAIGAVESQIRKAPTKTADQVAALQAPMAEFAKLSAERHKGLVNDMSESFAKRIRSLEKTDKFEAAELLVAAKRSFPGGAAINAIEIELPMAELAQGRKLLDQGKLNAARNQLNAAKSKNAGHSGIPAFEQELKAKMDQVLADYAKYKAGIGKAKPAEQKNYDKKYAALIRRWSDNSALKQLKIRARRQGECSIDLAGLGAKRGGACFDVISRKKGPQLVVVPTGTGVDRPFAIGKYEVTVAEFNLFCKATKECKALPRKRSKLPVTGISLAQAESYASWLSKEASKSEKRKVKYRLPTNSEWEYAANAAGAQPQKKYNCRVESRGTVIAGHALVNAKSGTQNGWGLANYIGNAQEWVKGSEGVVARGGAFEDPLARCELSLSRSHSGGADKITGFRIVRELG